MARDLLYLALHLIQSALGQKVEAKPVFHRERSQGAPVRERLEVACLASGMGLPMGRSQERASALRAKFGCPAGSGDSRIAAHAVSGVSMAPVRPAITFRTGFVQRTDEIPRRPGLGGRVRPGYKSHTKGPVDAPMTGTGSPRPRLQGWQQRQSRRQHPGASPAAGVERQNLRVPRGPLRDMGPVSTAVEATTWPGGTSSRQPAAWLSNSPQHLRWVHAAVGSR
jgi:hypothetical protein